MWGHTCIRGSLPAGMPTWPCWSIRLSICQWRTFCTVEASFRSCFIRFGHRQAGRHGCKGSCTCGVLRLSWPARRTWDGRVKARRLKQRQLVGRHCQLRYERRIRRAEHVQLPLRGRAVADLILLGAFRKACRQRLLKLLRGQQLFPAPSMYGHMLERSLTPWADTTQKDPSQASQAIMQESTHAKV